MKVLAILQNQWFKDPDRVRAFIERRPELRRNFIRRALFAGCKTGRILKAGLGEEWCRRIVWEEASPEIGGKASSCFPADPAHILKMIDEVKPTVILALGKIACDAMSVIMPPTMFTLLTAPHPTARGGPNPVLCLREIRAELDRLERK